MVVALVVGGIYLLSKIQEALLLLFLAIIFATAIEPLVNRLRRGPFSRGQGILVVYTGLFALLVLLGFLLVPPILDQGARFVEMLPERIAALRPYVQEIGVQPLRTALLNAMGQAQPAVRQTLEQPVAAEPEQLVATGGALLHTLVSIVTVFLLAFYWLTERASIKRAILRMVPPARARQVNATWLDVEAKLGGWVRGQLLVMLTIGVAAGLSFVLLGLPNALLLAVLAGLFEIIPMIGPVLSFIPAFLIALTIDPMKALLLVPIAFVIQQIEGNVLVPRIMSHSVGVSPLTVILGILIGASVYGPIGAFLAVPVAAAIQVILGELHPALDEEPANGQPAKAPLQPAEGPAMQPAAVPPAAE
jgi:predicted PurR-regulated permease PerM